MANKIRGLRRGEQIPEGDPRRYVAGHGYVRCRWRVARGQYVEAYEHRIDWESRRVSMAENVHHKNRDPGDNSPGNLVALTTAEHGRGHRRVDDGLAVTLYLEGRTTSQVARLVGCDVGHLSRVLARQGVPARPTSHYHEQRSEQDVRVAVEQSSSSVEVGRRLGVSKITARRLMREYGLPAFTPGRPRDRQT